MGILLDPPFCPKQHRRVRPQGAGPGLEGRAEMLPPRALTSGLSSQEVEEEAPLLLESSGQSPIRVAAELWGALWTVGGWEV